MQAAAATQNSHVLCKHACSRSTGATQAHCCGCTLSKHDIYSTPTWGRASSAVQGLQRRCSRSPASTCMHSGSTCRLTCATSLPTHCSIDSSLHSMAADQTVLQCLCLRVCAVHRSGWCFPGASHSMLSLLRMHQSLAVAMHCCHRLCCCELQAGWVVAMVYALMLCKACLQSFVRRLHLEACVIHQASRKLLQALSSCTAHLTKFNNTIQLMGSWDPATTSCCAAVMPGRQWQVCARCCCRCW
ncbi:hypothetical protein COO60DRAFT_785052 [Scenedesmus sp. NREL 46B-D3]|nr:hypothetical protein COO60DRAFT_785052 [Scenedesmus sp. NREL 46B-D3]